MLAPGGIKAVLGLLDSALQSVCLLQLEHLGLVVASSGSVLDVLGKRGIQISPSRQSKFLPFAILIALTHVHTHLSPCLRDF